MHITNEHKQLNGVGYKLIGACLSTGASQETAVNVLLCAASVEDLQRLNGCALDVFRREVEDIYYTDDSMRRGENGNLHALW